MVILTGANTDRAKRDDGEYFKNFSYRSVIKKTEGNAAKFGYTPAVYDLGSLGFGEPFLVEDQSFMEQGFYGQEVVKGYKSKSLFKPALVKHCLLKHKDLIVYIDGDAELRKRIDEIETDDYDIGVTLRDRFEFDSDWYKDHSNIVKYVNAGVIFFNYTDATMKFVDDWERLTDEVGNDQMALNELTCGDSYPEAGSVATINGIRIKYFSCLQYNYYYFGNRNPADAKIFHFKGDVRHFYPFNWPIRTYCAGRVMLKQVAKAVLGRR